MSSFVDPYERFVMLLKSRSCILHPYMHYSYTGGRHKNMPFHLDPPRNVLLFHWEWTLKIYPIGYPLNKCSKFLLLSLKSFVEVKRSMRLCKSYSWKEEKRKKEKKVLKKMDKCPRYIKQWVLRCPPKKEMNKIANVFL